MDAGKPDPLPISPHGPSLAGRIRGSLRDATRSAVAQDDAATPPRQDWRIAVSAGALLVAGPLLTIAGAHMLAGLVRADSARIERALAPRTAAATAARDARAELEPILARPGLGATMEALAGALPADAALRRAARDATGALTVQISTNDPDRLRDALRRSGTLPWLRDAGQEQGDGAMLVTLREVAP